MTSLYAALAVLFLGFACTMNTKIISRKDCKAAQFHFLFWKEKHAKAGLENPSPSAGGCPCPGTECLSAIPCKRGRAREKLSSS